MIITLASQRRTSTVVKEPLTYAKNKYIAAPVPAMMRVQRSNPPVEVPNDLGEIIKLIR